MSLLDFFKNPKTAAPDADRKENGGHRSDRQGNQNMLNIVEAPVPVQRVSEFVQEGFVTLTAVQANMILLECGFDGQRNISEGHVDVLADIMKRGQWEPKDKIDFALHGGSLILVNGYHRMHAQLRSGKPIEWTIVIHKCRTGDDVRSLYYKFDTNTRVRSGRQILAGVGFAEKSGLSKDIAAALFNAVPFIASGFSLSKRDRNILDSRVMDRRLRIASEYIDAAAKYEKCIEGVSGRVKKKFLAGGVMAVAMVTFRYQPITAMDFWTGAAQNDGLRKGDPRQTLFNDLIVRQLNAGSATQSVASPAAAWNAFFENRSLKIIKVYDRRAIRILGTPFEG